MKKKTAVSIIGVILLLFIALIGLLCHRLLIVEPTLRSELIRNKDSLLLLNKEKTTRIQTLKLLEDSISAIESQIQTLQKTESILRKKLAQQDSIVSEKERFIELVDVVDIFSAPHSYARGGYQVWGHGEELKSFRWNGYRSGSFSANVDGKPTHPGVRGPKEFTWDIKLEGPGAGFSKVALSKADSYINRSFTELMKEAGWELKPLGCIMWIKLFKYSNHEKSGWLTVDISSGSGGSYYTYTLYYHYDEIEDLDKLDTDCS